MTVPLLVRANSLYPRVDPLRQSPRLAARQNVSNPTPHQEEEDYLLTHNTRSRTRLRSITKEALLLSLNTTPTTPSKLSARQYPHELLNAVLDKTTGKLMQYRNLIRIPKYQEVWQRAYGNKLGHLAQGIHGQIQGTNTLFLIHKEDLPPDRWKDATYGSICVNYRPEK